ncbi:unnamed protein product [Rotaria sp. Silwood1]|nr:unnamed protein product [Rotaria sp. Silwood1]
MAEKIKPSLYTLPTELIYRILNYLDDFNLFCTMRNVCTRINTIMDSYRRYKTVITLDIGVNQIDDQATYYLADALRQNQTLIKLNLQLNQIGPQGAEYLANSLRQNQTLTRLNLHYNQIGDEGAKHLADALQQNKVVFPFFSVRYSLII